jgi:hypothetical protein
MPVQNIAVPFVTERQMGGSDIALVRQLVMKRGKQRLRETSGQKICALISP